MEGKPTVHALGTQFWPGGLDRYTIKTLLFIYFLGQKNPLFMKIIILIGHGGLCL